MKPEDIKLTDLQRIFIGEIPASFFLELIFRALFIYLLLMISMRLMGKRMASQISRNEMGAVASLAAAVGIPLMNPDRGLLPGLVIAAVIVVLQVLISKLSASNERFEAISQDKISLLVKDGVMDLENMKKTRITRERLFGQLRLLEKTNLGVVKRFYLEANGLFSLIEDPEPGPGLSLIPDYDHEFNGRRNSLTLLKACGKCGYVDDHAARIPLDSCPLCEARQWEFAVI